jgi:hypothetical protein
MLTIRLSHELYDEALCDLRRPHAHAAERVGFVYGRLVSAREPVILMKRFWPVPDQYYVQDFSVGARIHGDAIRAAMQNVLDTGDGLFHTHLHEWPGNPEFSDVDRRELRRFIPAFQTVGRGQATGLFLLGSDSATADIWLPRQNFPERATRIPVVGFPVRLIGG